MSKASEFGYHNEWVDRAQESLHDIDSSRYPVFKREELQLRESEIVAPPAPRLGDEQAARGVGAPDGDADAAEVLL